MTYEWPAEAKDRGYRIIARLCAISRVKGGPRWCLTEDQCARYPNEHKAV